MMSDAKQVGDAGSDAVVDSSNPAKGTIYDKDHPKVSPFVRYFGARPMDMEKSASMYAPDRDFSQLVLFLRSIELILATGQTAGFVNPMLDTAGDVPRDEESMSAAIQQAFDALVDFFDAAAGRDHRRGVDTVFAADDFKTFEDAEAEFYEKAGVGLVPLLLLFSRVILDRLFYAGRQDRVLGLPGKYTSAEAVNVALQFSEAMRHGDHEQRFFHVMKVAVHFGLASGMTPRQISLCVDKLCIETTQC